MTTYLATRTPLVRRLATRAEILTESRMLDYLGDNAESKRRASEVFELGLEP
jgi:hypothetical protein